MRDFGNLTPKYKFYPYCSLMEQQTCHIWQVLFFIDKGKFESEIDYKLL